jgi:hypothetical protein
MLTNSVSPTTHRPPIFSLIRRSFFTFTPSRPAVCLALFLFLFLVMAAPAALFAQTAVPPAAGDGSTANPYQIATLDNLYWLSQNSAAWTLKFLQTADIDASATADWDGGAGWTPIGNTTTPFTGAYDGDGHAIAGLTISRPDEDKVGLFGLLGSSSDSGLVKNLAVTDANVQGRSFVGAVSGHNDWGDILSCSASGTVSAVDEKAGGLVGFNWGGVVNCFSKCNVSGNSYVGGLVGYNDDYIRNSYAIRGTVTADGQYLGGLAGWNQRKVENSYSAVLVTGGAADAGGLIGGTASGGTVSGSFWDEYVSGMSVSDGGSGKTNELMRKQSTFTGAGWDFTTVWAWDAEINWGYPRLQNFAYPAAEEEIMVSFVTDRYPTECGAPRPLTLWVTPGQPYGPLPSPAFPLAKDCSIDGSWWSTGVNDCQLDDHGAGPSDEQKCASWNKTDNPECFLGWYIDSTQITPDTIVTRTEDHQVDAVFSEIYGNCFGDAYVYRPGEDFTISMHDRCISTGGLAGSTGGFPIYYRIISDTSTDDRMPVGQWDETISGTTPETCSGRAGYKVEATDSCALSVMGLDQLEIEWNDATPVVNNANSGMELWPGEPFEYFVNPDTFTDDFPDDDDGRTNLTYTSTLMNGDPLSAAGDIHFDADRLRYYGTAPSECGIDIDVRLIAADGCSEANDKFKFIVVKTRPAINRPIADQMAVAGKYWQFTLPADTFVSTNDETELIHYFPESYYWVDFDPATLTFTSMNRGEPGELPDHWTGEKFFDMPVRARTQCSLTITSTFLLNVVPTVSAFEGGDGAQANPYQVATAEQLDHVRALLNQSGVYFIQTADIDLTGYLAEGGAGWQEWGDAGWQPIGDLDNPFLGEYDGGGFTVRGLEIQRDTDCLGLFGYLGFGGKISNLQVITAREGAVKGADGGQFVGALLGYNAGGTVEACRSSGAVSGGDAVGGLVGANTAAGVVRQSESDCVTGGTSRVGGLVGWNDDASIEQGHAAGSVGAAESAGGLVGSNTAGGAISNCHASGSVLRTAGGTDTGFGGFAGFAGDGTSIAHSFSVGGVDYANQDDPADKGFVGTKSGACVFTANFFDAEASGQTSDAAGAAAPQFTAAMNLQATFTAAGWDFAGETSNGTEDIWEMDGSSNNGYPFFSWQSFPLPRVETHAVTEITGGAATAGGEVIDPGDSPVTERGLIWGRERPVSMANRDGRFVDDGAGAFTGALSGLAAGATYAVRAYASNARGTGYGEERIFTTLRVPPGNALDFDGDDDRVVIADDPGLDLTAAYTIEAWIRPDSFSWLGGIVSKYHSKSANGYILRLSGSGNFRGIGFDGLETADDLLTAGRWVHVAAVNDNGARSLYLNGMPQSLSGTAISVVANEEPLMIGVDFGNGSTPRSFDGRIDEVRVWNTARTESDIRSGMNRILDGDESGLVAYYRMDAISGSVVTDETGNGHHGEATNMDDADRVASGAPLGHVSTWRYTDAWTGETVSLAHGDGDGLTISGVTGDPDGVQLFRIDDVPNAVDPPAGWDRIADLRHWGVFLVGGTSPAATVAYAYAGYPDNTDSYLAGFAGRMAADDPAWTDPGAIIDPEAGTLAASNQTGGQYVLGWLLDTDGDGIGDAWEEEHFSGLTAADATSDGDGDSISDKEEFIKSRNGEVDPLGVPYDPAVGNTPDSFTLTYTAGPNGTITGTSPQTVPYGGDGSAVTAVPAPGHYFVEWSDGETANPRTDLNVTVNISVTAVFAFGTDRDGDIDGDDDVDLADAVTGLKILADIPPASVNLGADVNGNQRIGLEEVIYVLQKVAELR